MMGLGFISRPSTLCMLFCALWPVDVRAAWKPGTMAKKRCSICFSTQHRRQSCPDVLQSDMESDDTAEGRGPELHSLHDNLLAACRSGDAAQVNEILAAGVDVNAHRNHCLLVSPLHRAAYWGHATVVEQLLSCGAQVSMRNRVDYTALHWAALRGAADVVSVLVSASADVNAVEREGNTPLHFAARGGFPEICSLLLHGGAHINAVTSVWHYTPLMYAAMRGEIDCLHLLLAEGADMEMTCSKGLSAVGWAQSLCRTDCVHMLCSHMGSWQPCIKFADISPEMAELEQLGLLTTPSTSVEGPHALLRQRYPGGDGDRSSGGEAAAGET